MAKRERCYEFSKSQKRRAKHCAGYQCERCESKNDLQVHHLIPVEFARLHALKPDDVRRDENAQVLCALCHEAANQEQIDNWHLLPQLARKLLGIRMSQ